MRKLECYLPSPRKLVCGMTKVKDGLSPHSKACCMASAVVLIADISVSKLGKKKINRCRWTGNVVWPSCGMK